jgi:hypothetical protein
MGKGTFKKIGESAQPMYGPRGMLVCGFAPAEQDAIMKFLGDIPLADLSVIFATASDSGERLCDLLTRPDQSGRSADCGPVRAVVLSGITEKELHRIISAYQDAGLPRPLWASLTPFSEGWTLSALLEELKKERIAMEKNKT